MIPILLMHFGFNDYLTVINQFIAKAIDIFGLFIHYSCIYLYLFIYLFVYLFINLFIHVFIYLCIRVFIYSYININ